MNISIRSKQLIYCLTGSYFPIKFARNIHSERDTQKTAALTLRSHFISKCKPLGAIISIILFDGLYHLRTGQNNFIARKH